jgi:hypothetical protein
VDWMRSQHGFFAYGAEDGYLVLVSEEGVRLTRFSIAAGAEGLTAVTAREAASTVIMFPLGRGGGRPGGAPELAALAEVAKVYAEAYEDGQEVTFEVAGGRRPYPGWERKRSVARFFETGNANDCPSC